MSHPVPPSQPELTTTFVCSKEDSMLEGIELCADIGFFFSKKASLVYCLFLHFVGYMSSDDSNEPKYTNNNRFRGLFR